MQGTSHEKGHPIPSMTTGLQTGATGTLDLIVRGSDIGLDHVVVPQGRVLSAARDLAQELLKQSAEGLRLTKQILHADEGTQSKQAISLLPSVRIDIYNLASAKSESAEARLERIAWIRLRSPRKAA